jgi:WD40 repeat protein
MRIPLRRLLALGAIVAVAAVLALDRRRPDPSPAAEGALVEQRSQAVTLRTLAKDLIAREVAAGRRPLLEAAALFGALNRLPPAQRACPPVEPTDPYLGIPAGSEEEWLCRQVVLYVRAEARQSGPPGRAETAVARLEAEFRAELHARGAIRLPDAPPLEPLLARARQALAEVRAGVRPKPDLVLQVGPRESVTAVAFSPDGRLVASGSDRVRVYDRQTGTLLRAIGCDASRGVRVLAFAPDGRRLVGAGAEMDKTVKVWDARTGALVMALAGHVAADPGNLYAEIYALAFSPDGKSLATAGRDKLVIVWDFETGKVRHRLAGHEGEVGSLAFAPDGRTLAGGGADKTIRLWDPATGQLRATLRGHPDRVNALAFSPDGRALASGSSDWARFRGRNPARAPGPVPPGACEVRLWDPATGRVVWHFAGPGRVSSLAFSPDGVKLACGIGDAVRLHDAGTGRADGIAFTHDGEVTAVAFAPDGRALASGSHDRTVAVVSLPERTPVLRLPGSWEHVYSVAIAPDGAAIAAGSSDIRFAEGRRRAGDPALGPGGVRLWDARTGHLRWGRVGPAEQVAAVACSPDGGWVASGGAIVRLLDAKDGASVWARHDHQATVLAVAFAPDGRTLASAGADGTVRLRDVPTGAVRQTLAGHEGAVTAVVFSADGATLLSGGADQTVRLWDARTGQPGRVLRADGPKPGAPRAGEGAVTAVALSPDGATLATCCSSAAPEYGDRHVRLWEVRTGRLLHTLERPQSRGRLVSFSPDGATLAANGTGKAIALWDVRTGRFLKELSGHPHPPLSAAFAPDGRTLVSGADYQELKVWDVGGGRLLATLRSLAEGRVGGADDWLAVTADGDYDGSPGAERYLAWRAGDELLPAGRLTPARRPDLVAAALGAGR